MTSTKELPITESIRQVTASFKIVDDLTANLHVNDFNLLRLFAIASFVIPHLQFSISFAFYSEIKRFTLQFFISSSLFLIIFLHIFYTCIFCILFLEFFIIVDFNLHVFVFLVFLSNEITYVCFYLFM